MPQPEAGPPATTPYVSRLGRRIAPRSRLRALASGLRTVARHGWAHASSAALAFVPRVRAVQAGEDPNAASPKAAIYVTYDREARVADFVLAQIAALAAEGWRITVVSNSPALHAPPELLRHVRAILHRRNVGHDFGAYRDGLAALGDLSGVQRLLLANDSCYGPFAPIGEIERQAEAGGFDLFGVSDSWAHAYHVQSYYLCIGRRILESEAFAAFWRRLLISQPRSMVISHGEIGFTQSMLRAGFTAGALCPYPQVAQIARDRASARLTRETLLPREKSYLEDLVQDVDFGVPLNPTYFFWDVLVRDFGAPFIKRDLLKRNPTQQPGLAAWAEIAGKDAGPIWQHLK